MNDLENLVNDLNELVSRYQHCNDKAKQLEDELETLRHENLQLSLRQEQTDLILGNVLGQLRTLKDEERHAHG